MALPVEVVKVFPIIEQFLHPSSLIISREASSSKINFEMTTLDVLDNLMLNLLIELRTSPIAHPSVAW